MLNPTGGNRELPLTLVSRHLLMYSRWKVWFRLGWYGTLHSHCRLLLSTRVQGMCPVSSSRPELTIAQNRSYRELDILFHRRVPARKFKSTVIGAEEDN